MKDRRLQKLSSIPWIEIISVLSLFYFIQGAVLYMSSGFLSETIYSFISANDIESLGRIIRKIGKYILLLAVSAFTLTSAIYHIRKLIKKQH